ncbi:MAG: type II toxin-antitoxin system VapC family toxin [Deltaproteobacteria bacterium]|nr:type II toxin-antitoxin system VapC family toxin [Deltaproteobacteria bacterium]
MGFLIDTNVLSELRKGARMDANVRLWFDSIASEDIHISTLVLGEIRHGIELMRRRDEIGAERLENWLFSVRGEAGDRILPVTAEIADCWGRMGIPDPISVIDGLLAATALHHNLTLVTRNVRDVMRTGAVLLNPFEAN